MQQFVQATRHWHSYDGHKEVWLHYASLFCNKQNPTYCVFFSVLQIGLPFSIAISSIENRSDGCAASITQITDYILDIVSDLQIFHKKSIHVV